MARTAHRADHWYMGALLLLLVVGIVTLSSASAPVAFERFGDKYFFLKRQLLFGALPGMAAFAFFYFFDYKWLRKIPWWVYGLATLLLLSLSFIPGLGLTINNAQSWITIGSFALQPSEFAKLIFIVCIALWLDRRGRAGATRFFSDIVPFVALLALPLLLLIKQSDIGTLMIVAAIALIMLLVARARLLHVGVLVLLLAIVGWTLIAITPYRAERIMTFLHPELDPQGVGYHINQAFLAIGSGGFWGLGYGNSRQKFQYLPEVSADSIFAVMAEEFGFIISALVIALLLFIFLRGLRIARNASDQFGAYLATGIACWFGIQSMVNISAMVGLVPLTGLPLPFISHGGSAVLSGLMAAGIMMNISRQARPLE